jgi:hypothetical protein
VYRGRQRQGPPHQWPPPPPPRGHASSSSAEAASRSPISEERESHPPHMATALGGGPHPAPAAATDAMEVDPPRVSVDGKVSVFLSAPASLSRRSTSPERQVRFPIRLPRSVHCYWGGSAPLRARIGDYSLAAFFPRFSALILAAD